MAYPISDVTRRIVYSGSAGVGPYSFSFEVLSSSDIAVYKDQTLLTLTTDYTVAIGVDGTGSVTLVVAATAANNITLVGSRAIERTTDFVTGGDLFANSLNDELDSLVIFAQQVDEKAGRGLKAPVTDPTDVNMQLPAKAVRKGTVLGFNATTGDPEAGPTIADVGTLAAITADISTLADIEDGTDATDAIQTVAGISGNVTTVAGISSNVTTVAANNANVTTVATDLAGSDNIGTVAGSIANVNTTATSIANVNTVAGISANVTTVATNNANVTTVAGAISNVNTTATNIANVNTTAADISNVNTTAADISNVNTVATNIADVNTVATDLGGTDTIGTVATNITNVNTVGGISANVTTVAGISSDVTTVAADGTDIGTVATNIANVNTVAGISANVTTVAGISSDVTTVAADGTDIGTVAGISAQVSEVAGISGNVTTVAGISGNVTTVAGISSDVTAVAADATDIGTVATDLAGSNTIGTVAGISADVTTVAGISANVTTVAGISANVTTVAGDSANISTLAGITSDITQVAFISSDITAVANDYVDIGTVANDILGPNTIDTVATNIANVNTVAGISSDVTTVASNVADVTNFADVYYGAAASDPSTRKDASALQAGDLYFNTTDDVMHVYDGAAWEAVTDLTTVTSTISPTNAYLYVPFISGNTSGDYTLQVSSDIKVWPSLNIVYLDANTTVNGVLSPTFIDFSDGTSSTQHLRFGSSDDIKIYYDGVTDNALTFFDGSNVILELFKTSGNLELHGKMTVGADPTANLEVATKQYVDNATAAALHYHDPVRVETPTALTATYNNGSSGVGATLTNSGTQAALVIDGITLSTNDRVLVYNQATAAHNGVYTVTNVGSASTNWVLTRATDADSYGASDPVSLGQGDSFFVLEGDTGAGESYVLTTQGTITFGTTDITFSQFAAAPAYGDGALTMNVSGVGLSGSQTFTANQTSNATFTVTSNATNANTASTIVARDASGNFSAGTITAALSGNATTATTASATTATLTRGSYLTGSNFNGSSATTWAVDAATANTASKIVARDASGNFSAGTITAALSGNADTATTATSATTATNATNVALTNTSTFGTYYIPFASGNSTSNYALGVSGLSYNPAFGALSVSSINAQTINPDIIDFGDGSSATEHLRFGGSDDVKFFYNGTANTMELELEASSNSFIITDNGTTRFTFAKTSGDFTATGKVVDHVEFTSTAATAYTLVAGDQGNMVKTTSASAVTITVPTNASVGYSVGAKIDLVQYGAGQITVAGDTGVTVNATPTLKTRTQYSAASLVKVATDEWLLVGDLADS